MLRQLIVSPVLTRAGSGTHWISVRSLFNLISILMTLSFSVRLVWEQAFADVDPDEALPNRDACGVQSRPAFAVRSFRLCVRHDRGLPQVHKRAPRSAERLHSSAL